MHDPGASMAGEDGTDQPPPVSRWVQAGPALDLADSQSDRSPASIAHDSWAGQVPAVHHGGG